jgi:hypothetical protein
VPVTQDNLYYKWTDYLNNPTPRAQVPFDDLYGQTGLNEEHVRISASTGSRVMDFIELEGLTNIQRPRMLNRTSLTQSVSGPLKLKGTTSVTLGGSSSFTYTLNPGADVTIAAGTKIVFKPGAKALKGAKLKAKTGTTAMQKSALITNTNNPVSYSITSPYIGKVSIYEDDTERTTEIDPIFSSEKEVNIFPNPSNGLLTITINGFSTLKGIVTVTNGIGNNVYEMQLNSNQQQVDLQMLPNGLYFVSVNINGDIYREKILINK